MGREERGESVKCRVEGFAGCGVSGKFFRSLVRRFVIIGGREARRLVLRREFFDGFDLYVEVSLKRRFFGRDRGGVCFVGVGGDEEGSWI